MAGAPAKEDPQAPPLPSRAKWAHGALFLGLALTIAGADLWTKALIFRVLKVQLQEIPGVGRQAVLPHRPIVVVPNLFELEANINYGAFSGWFARHTGVLTVLSIAALGVVAWFLVAHLRGPGPHRLWFTAALGLLWGGTLGNLYDRALFGYVRDFIKWFFVRDGRAYVWPNFNIADSGICVGVGIILALILLDSRRRRPAAEPARSTAGR